MTLHPRLLLAALVLGLPLAIAAPGFRDVLDVPAAPSVLAPQALLNGLAASGRRVVAAGQRGHIVYSDDAGKSWRQASVPVSADLVALSFPSERAGWAVGHDGVILKSEDGGATWTRVLDGRSVGRTVVAYYEAQAGQGALGTADEAAKLIDEAKRYSAQGAEIPFLDVWFADEQNGFVVGAFNTLLRTRDGGKNWEPWFHRTDNPTRLHLYAVRGVGADVYITGEQGLVLKLAADGERFVAVETPYKGTYFGVTGTDDAVLVFGLRGNAYRSVDAGKTWTKIDTGLQDGLTAGSRLGAHGLVLVSQAGHVLVSRDDGQHFAPQKRERSAPAAAVVAGPDTLVIAGPRGVHSEALR